MSFWKPTHFLSSISASVKAVMQPAGPEKGVGIITAAYVKEPTHPQWRDTPEYQQFLEPVEVIRVRPFKPKSFVIGQSNGDRVFMGGDKFKRVVVIIMDSFVSEGFICTAHGDVVAVLVPADIYFVSRHAIEVCERALDGLAVDVSRAHESQLL